MTDACLFDRLGAWLPLFAAAGVLQLTKLALLRPRLGRVGPPAPDVASLGELLHHGRYRGIPVRAEPPGPFGGGRFLPGLRRRGEIRLEEGMLKRNDVDALAILEHERGHAERDLPAPRPYRLGLVGLCLAGLALGLENRELAGAGTALMWLGFGLAGLHFLRNEAAASEYALRELWTRGWARPLWRAAIGRLAAAYGAYLADWAAAAAAVALVTAALGCR
ncbi:MAG TPA: hypothetical protein VG370_29330 [Chloroflexota bacterium]|jgi:hypothetical protein|nr:hypothetical protein [Chloroflexota bacterium]